MVSLKAHTCRVLGIRGAQAARLASDSSQLFEQLSPTLAPSSTAAGSTMSEQTGSFLS